MLKNIRESMDTEFGRNPGDRARIVEDSNSGVLSLQICKVCVLVVVVGVGQRETTSCSAHGNHNNSGHP